MEISEIKHLLKQEVEKVGVKLNPKGFGLCPFHSEKTPSFLVKDDRYKCFGCGEGGDVVDFVQKYHNFDFTKAMRYLGGEKVKFRPKKPLVNWAKKLQVWKDAEINRLGPILCNAGILIAGIRTREDMDRLAPVLHMQAEMEYHFDILLYGDVKQRTALRNQYVKCRSKEI
jgi:hypothetical protein